MSTQAYRELTRIETALRAAILEDSQLVTDLFRRYKLAGGYANLADITHEVQAHANGKRPALKVKS